MVVTVKRNIYIYKVKIKGVSTLDKTFLFEKFSEKNIPNNTVDVENENYVFVSYKLEGNLLAGIFVKEKDLSQVIVNKSKLKSFLSFFKFRRNQDPGEATHLLWDLENNIIISEMNWSGARHISKSFGKYLKGTINREIEVQPILQEEEYKKLFLKNHTLKRLSLSVPRPRVNIVYETLGIDVKAMKKYITNDEDLELEISLICKRYKKGLKLLPQPILDMYSKIKGLNNNEDLRLYVQDSSQNVLSLLDGALVKEQMEFEINEEAKVINKDNFFNQTKTFWEEKKEEILKLIQDVQKTQTK